MNDDTSDVLAGPRGSGLLGPAGTSSCSDGVGAQALTGGSAVTSTRKYSRGKRSSSLHRSLLK